MLIGLWLWAFGMAFGPRTPPFHLRPSISTVVPPYTVHRAVGNNTQQPQVQKQTISHDPPACGPGARKEKERKKPPIWYYAVGVTVGSPHGSPGLYKVRLSLRPSSSRRVWSLLLLKPSKNSAPRPLPWRGLAQQKRAVSLSNGHE